MARSRKRLAFFVVLEGIALVALVISEVRQIPDTVDDLLTNHSQSVAGVKYYDNRELGYDATGDRFRGQQLLEVLRKGKILRDWNEGTNLTGAIHILYDDESYDTISLLSQDPVLIKGYAVRVDRDDLLHVLRLLTPVPPPPAPAGSVW
ncbi:MAG: hypothetical protein BWX88_03578 [Planctomycetes bacterium ADurb.Bin126]|nr:MAG: hypothetical protein BWX88_03578 [Planctomycetes bacterium ADurb.Bin126]HOD83107.1 hypothetical protein [Phycisphaerae bacterium]HQL71714.1 hypothetical protein [Phycisphaerae bacterium]